MDGVLERYQGGSLTEDALVAALVAHPHWRIPLRLDGATPTLVWGTSPAGPILCVYSSRAAFDAGPHRGHAFAGVNAHGWIDALADAAGVRVNAGSPHGIERPRSWFGALRDARRTADVDGILARTGSVPRPWRALREHVWSVIVVGERDDRTWHLPNDAGGRRLAVVFSAAHLARGYASFGPHTRAEPRAGRQLFADLARSGLDGVWLNPATPTERAVGLEFAEAVLDGVDPEPAPDVLPARSRAEVELYLALRGDPDPHLEPATRHGEDVLLYTGMLHGHDAELAFVERPSGGPSALIDPAALLRHAESLSGSVTDRTPASDAADRLDLALWCVQEVLRFIPPGGRQVPLDAFRSSAGRRLARTSPERFARHTLEGTADALRARLVTARASR